MRLFGIILFLSAILLIIWVKKRQFKRVNKYGIEEFDNMYHKALFPRIEKILWYIAIGSILWSIVLIFH